MERVIIVDYGMGNLHSVQKAVAAMGAEPVLSQCAQEIADAPRLILPGVGAFGDAMAELKRLQLVAPIRQAAQGGTPLLGICLGMQLLFRGSEEGGWHDGLNLLPGRITRMRAAGNKVPHMGWNDVENRDDVLLANLPAQFSVYFVHSFCAQDAEAPFVSGVTTYGTPFACAVRRANVCGTQFHPEKSGANGLQILRNFLALEREGSVC